MSTNNYHEVPLEEEVQQLRQQVDELTRQLAAIHVVSSEGENPFAPPARPEDIPEFQGDLQPDEFLDWLRAVEAILVSKKVPPHLQVHLVVPRLRGRAKTWWGQLTARRAREGKSPIESWPKLAKSMRVAFLPHNYERVLYQRLQDLRQGSGTVDKYTDSFYGLLERMVDVNENTESSQLVARYIGGLRPSVQKVFNDLDPFTVSEAHQRARQEEKQEKRIQEYNEKIDNVAIALVLGLGTYVCLCGYYYVLTYRRK